MSFMTLKNVCAKALAKHFSKKKIHGFCMFFKFKRSILRFFFVVLFFYSFFKRSYNLRDCESDGQISCET
eukprot:UN01733